MQRSKNTDLKIQIGKRECPADAGHFLPLLPDKGKTNHQKLILQFLDRIRPLMYKAPVPGAAPGFDRGELVDKRTRYV